MEEDPEQSILLFLDILLDIGPNFWILATITVAIILILLFLSGCISASENAFFSLSPQDILELEELEHKSDSIALALIQKPNPKEAAQNLLGTILILNNFINIALIICASYALGNLWTALNTQLSPIFTFAIEVILITFLLVLFGEIIPKIYATQNNIRLVRFTSKLLFYAQKILRPFVWMLTKSTVLIDQRLSQKSAPVSIEELNQAIDLASEDDNIDEKKILKGIVNFGSISVRQIMCSRVDVKALSTETTSDVLLSSVQEWGFSRVPVFEENFDNVVGILYMKDLITKELLNEKKPWTNIIREPFFVPANKKIDDLLKEFQDKRTHMAIVVDEYGGSLGIVTMEDILEEIFGEIRDEFDEDELIYSKLDNETFIFEAKTLLTDITKILDLSPDYFDEHRGESDTLAGMLMEIHEKIPAVGIEIEAEQFSFIIESADNRKIKRVKMKIKKGEINDEQDND